MNGKSCSSRLFTSRFDSGFVPGRVSIIIPTFNYGHFLSDSLQSALTQRVRDLEVIVVDDGSTDETVHILEPFNAEIKYIYQNNAGLSAARNTGIANSTGEFILFLDADDILGPNAIAFQLTYLKRHPEVHVVVCQNRLFEKTRPDGRPMPIGAWRLFRRNLDLHLCYFNIAPPHAFLSRREAIMKTGPFDTELRACEDYDFWLRASAKGFVPHFNPFGLVYYRRHRTSMSANSENQLLHDAILHDRVSVLLDQCPEYPIGRRLEGLVAFSAGACRTAAMCQGGSTKTLDLIQLALQALEEAGETASSSRSDLSIITSLYSLKILSNLTCPCFKDYEIAGAVHNHITKILSGAKAPASEVRLLVNVFMSGLSVSTDCIRERRELGKLVLSYLRKRFMLSGRRKGVLRHRCHQPMLY